MIVDSNCLYFASVIKNAVHNPAGKTVNVGPFQCKVRVAGVQCSVDAGLCALFL